MARSAQAGPDFRPGRADGPKLAAGPGRSARPITFYGPFGQAVRPGLAASFGPSALFLNINKKTC